jgi:hypothetical protein
MEKGLTDYWAGFWPTAFDLVGHWPAWPRPMATGQPSRPALAGERLTVTARSAPAAAQWLPAARAMRRGSEEVVSTGGGKAFLPSKERAVETERSGGGTSGVVEKLGAMAFFWRQRLSMMMCGTVACTSLRRSCGGCWATRWGSGAHRAATWHEGCGGGRCSGTPRRRRCSSGRPWLGGGPTTPEEEGNTTSIF